jgi:hypothetical protein
METPLTLLAAAMLALTMVFGIRARVRGGA